jgi:hypothetical protein
VSGSSTKVPAFCDWQHFLAGSATKCCHLVTAKKEAARPDATPVALMHGEQLVNLLMEHDIGVRRTKHDLIELGDTLDE